MIKFIKIIDDNGLPGRDIICDKCGNGENVKGGPCLKTLDVIPLYCSIHDVVNFNQPDRSKREDTRLNEMIEKVMFARNDLVLLGKPVSEKLLQEIIEYLVMRCSEQ